MCSISASIGSASQAISRPRSAACASGSVSISWRVYQGLRARQAGGRLVQRHAECAAVGRREASNTGS